MIGTDGVSLVDSLTLTNDGFAGIGTTSPDYPLPVTGDHARTLDVENSAGSGEGTAGYFETSSDSGGAIHVNASSSLGTTYALYAEADSVDGYWQGP